MGYSEIILQFPLGMYLTSINTATSVNLVYIFMPVSYNFKSYC